MSVALAQECLVSPEDYLQAETLGATKHEYVGGVIYAMAGARNRHNQIATNILGELHALLRGRPCQPFNSDTKVRIQNGDDLRFYYPDAMIVCEPNDPDDVFQDRPVIIFEVLSESTARVDREEKLRAYQSIASLRAYAVVESERIGVTCHQRADLNASWTVATISNRAGRLILPAVGCNLPLDALYARAGL